MTDTCSDSAGPVDILPVGLGSIGAVYAYLLEKSGKARGVILDTERFGKLDNWKPYRVFRFQKEALEDGTFYSLCIVCTKYWRLQLDNGFGIEQDLYHGLEGQDIPIISSCAWIGIMTSLDGKLPKEIAALDQCVDCLKSGGGNVHITERIDSIRFSKNIWNCTWASVQGLVRTTAFAFAHLSHEHAEWYGPVSNGEVSLGLENAVQYCWEKITGMTVQRGVGHKYSLLAVVEMGRPFEVEVIVGSVLDLVQKHNVPVPKLEFIYVFIKGPSERNYQVAATEDWKQLFWGIERVKWS
ncbi:uncharacterized protein L203_100578 [Cryptococcus depauperatus CBS 7841]|uniref:Ketopantoate reductase C-terminal domain-containing protein n=1 Tax=Cryptococcus depauperatus CBS 7841 TaxID=1295531 RepID=A0AAJ8JN93_9TREE